jgi:hypothetical protein
MKSFRPLAKGVNKAIVKLTQLFGIEADIYLPLSYNNTSTGYIDNDITYEDEPSYSNKLLFPYILKEKNKSMGMVDELFADDDKVVYLYDDIINLVKFSKIVFPTISGVNTYIIKDISDISDDEQIILRKAFLVPDEYITKENIELIEESVEEVNDLDGTEDGAEVEMPINNTYQKDSDLSGGIVFDPIQ